MKLDKLKFKVRNFIESNQYIRNLKPKIIHKINLFLNNKIRAEKFWKFYKVNYR